MMTPRLASAAESGLLDDAPTDRQALEAQQPAFVDFGCGHGASMRLGEKLMRGVGMGVEIDPEKARLACEAGYDVVHGDLLQSELKGIAPAATAIDVMPELGSLQAFEVALTRMARASRDFVLVQHLCFDSAEALLARGFTVADYTARSVRIRPRLADYVQFVERFGARLEIVGLAAFGIGEPKVLPLSFLRVRGPLFLHAEALPAYRSVRVIIGRKSVARFRAALRRGAAGDGRLIWERSEE